MKRPILPAILAAAALNLASLNLAAQDICVSIFPDRTFQTIEGFAASDAWSGNFAGGLWAESEKARVAEWLFSTEYGSDGNPRGIGLSIWRVNLGAGTFEQEGADIMPIQRRAESFIGADGKSYDWSKCAGQQYFMNKASEYGCNDFVLFSNSPLVQYTLNGKGWSAHDNSANIKPNCYREYAEYMAEVASHFRGNGLNITHISPINEPQVNWDSPRQEGSPWAKSEIKKMFTALDEVLDAREDLSDVNMLFGEAANLKVLYEKSDGLRGRFAGEEAPDNLVESFFNEKSKYYIGDLKHLPRSIAAHTYHNHTNNTELREVRRRAGDRCREYGLRYEQSEWCMLPNYLPPMDGFTSDWKGGNRGDIQVGLLMGRLIHSDIVDGGACSWGYWKSMELNGSHALVALHAKDGSIFNGGTVSANKILWALGNFSLFVRPGFVRVGAEGADDLDSVAASSFASPDGSRIVCVFVNSSFEGHDAGIVLPRGYERRIKNCMVYRTDKDNDLSQEKDAVSFSRKAKSKNIRCSLPPRSLSTLVIDMKPTKR
jgi:hypothetical protein